MVISKSVECKRPTVNNAWIRKRGGIIRNSVHVDFDSAGSPMSYQRDFRFVKRSIHARSVRGRKNYEGTRSIIFHHQMQGIPRTGGQEQKVSMKKKNGKKGSRGSKFSNWKNLPSPRRSGKQ